MNYEGPDGLNDYLSAVDLGAGARAVVEAPAVGHVVAAPSDALVFQGEYQRVGDDLVISSPDGVSFLVDNYFSGTSRAPIRAPNGAELDGATVSALAGAIHHDAYAQAGGAAPAAIGRVEIAAGAATALRNGQLLTLHTGDPIQLGDVLQTGSGSRLGVSFVDGTAFNLTANARMVVNEMVYDASGSQNSSLLNLVQGSISFVAGQVAHTGDMKVDTPVATMGIRGTAVHVFISASNGTTRFSVLTEPDGRVGSYELFDKNGRSLALVSRSDQVTVAQPNGQITTLDKTQAERDADAATVQQVFEVYTDGQQFLQHPRQPGQQPDQPGPDQHGGGYVPPQNPIIQHAELGVSACDSVGGKWRRPRINTV